MSTKVINFPKGTFNNLITKDTVAKMSKLGGKAYGTVLRADAGYVIEVDDTTIAKLAIADLHAPDGLVIPVGTKIFFNEDASFSHFQIEVKEAKPAAAPVQTDRKVGAVERPKASPMFDRE